jgi:hypothetical protein
MDSMTIDARHFFILFFGAGNPGLQAGEEAPPPVAVSDLSCYAGPASIASRSHSLPDGKRV